MLFVLNREVSRRSDEGLLGQKVTMDFGANKEAAYFLPANGVWRLVTRRGVSRNAAPVDAKSEKRYSQGGCE